MGEKEIKLGDKILVGLTEELSPEKEEYVYGYLMEVLTGGLYPNKFDVLREYVQNSYDAVIEFKNKFEYVDEKPILIDIDYPSITIYDTGTGMDIEKIKQYRYIGFSQKEMGKAVGFQGIGKLAGITVAEKLVVTTSPYGVGEMYTLTFDAEKMLERVRDLRGEQKNITIKKLVLDHTDIATKEEKKEQHYTFVELNGVKDEFKGLFEKDKIIDYLGRTVPVAFHPDFEFGRAIDEKLRMFVDDYDWVRILVDGNEVYKPYRPDIKFPEFIPVYGDKKMVAYAWACQHVKSEQLKPRTDAGLIFRKKNFRVGNSFLPRNTFWKVTDFLSFYFYGEIHVCDRNVLPTASRDDFKQNKVRDSLYGQCVVIYKTLNQLARGKSRKMRAYHFLKAGEQLVEDVSKEIEAGEIPAELIDKRISELVIAGEDVVKRAKDIPLEDKKAKFRASGVVNELNSLLKKIKNPQVAKKEKRTYEITERLSLSGESSQLYTVIVQAIRDFFIDDADGFERLLKKIHSNLEQKFRRD